MAKLTEEDIKHVAKLAKLTLTPKEVTKFQKQLSSIVDYISELNKVDTSNIQPTSQTTGLTNIFRQDEINPTHTLTADQALSGVDNSYNGFFKVGRIIDK